MNEDMKKFLRAVQATVQVTNIRSKIKSRQEYIEGLPAAERKGRIAYDMLSLTDQELSQVVGLLTHHTVLMTQVATGSNPFESGLQAKLRQAIKHEETLSNESKTKVLPSLFEAGQENNQEKALQVAKLYVSLTQQAAEAAKQVKHLQAEVIKPENAGSLSTQEVTAVQEVVADLMGAITKRQVSPLEAYSTLMAIRPSRTDTDIQG